MKICYILKVCALCLLTTIFLFGQNCFLEDFVPKYATIPPYIDSAKTTETPNVTVTINTDTLGKVSKYVLGNAVAVWVGANVNNPTLVSHLQQLAPALIRFPGGSWSNIYFWNGNPGDVPNQLMGSNDQLGPFGPQFGPNLSLTVDQYYSLRNQIGAQGLITINYGYARYGTSAQPAKQAAHYAADWVRYDNGRTKFWEIGNENAGSWEAGWKIDTSKNKDGQPYLISGALYGRHFKIFVDSMKAAAAERGATIYIGGIIYQYNGSGGNIVDQHWNEGFFNEVGDSADFYVMHNYFGSGSSFLKIQVDAARNEINNNITFIRGDIANKGAHSKPIAVTEWNCGGPDTVKTSTINGMQAVVLFCEIMKNNFGMSARWLVANWDKDGMFYYKTPTDPGIPLWNPRPDFYYTYYLQHFIGDHIVSTTVTASPTYSDILAYATRFASGETGVVVVNKGSAGKVVKLATGNIGVGDRFYVYSLTGASDDTYGKSQAVVVNGVGSISVPWGPLENLEIIPACAYSVGDQIRLMSPARSVQYVMIESGSNPLSVGNEKHSVIVDRFELNQNYPNPFNPQTSISYSLPRASTVALKVYDILGREVVSLINNERESEGIHKVTFDATNLPSGVYFYRLQAEDYAETKSMVLIK